jgi:hypothetical protein
MAFIGGVLALVFLKYLSSHKPYPVNDPRLGEALGVQHYELSHDAPGGHGTAGGH